MKTPSSSKPFLQRLLQLFGIYLVILFFAAFFTPFLWRVLHEFKGFGYSRIFDRLRYIGFLFFLPVLWKMAGFKNFRAIGWKNPKGGLAAIYVGALSALLLGFFFVSNLHPTQSLGVPKILESVLEGFVIAIAVSFLEEIIFRGILQTILVKKGGAWAGIIFGALIFAWLHGRPSPHTFPIAEHPWNENFLLAYRYISTWPINLTPMAFVNLFILGTALGLLYYKSGSLWLSIGLHLGLVAAAVPLVRLLSNLDSTLSLTSFTGSPATSAMLLILVGLVAAWKLPKPAAA